ncbi:MAG: transcription antitermination factor NusB [Bacteroidales bacterium]|nr:transcription antitermination factor NusB [Bacteroidales bacterium]
MVNRHFLRQKVLQSLYAYYSSGAESIEKQEKFLFENIYKLYDLEIYLMAAVLEIRDLEEKRIEEAKNKFYPTEEERNPNMRFVNNAYLKRLGEHEELKKAIEKLHVNFVNDKTLLFTILQHFRQSESYLDYMNKETNCFEDDRKIIVQLFKNYIIKNENLYEVLCEHGFTWECDYEYVCQVVLQFLKTWLEDDYPQKTLPYPFDKSMEDTTENDREFVKNVFRNTINHGFEYESYIEKRSQNWDKERLAVIDVFIIKMAITEFIYCPSIPIKVTLNEYIELAKEFSTDKSRLFVNGVLDRIITDLRVDDKIHKEEEEDLLFFESNDELREVYSHNFHIKDEK